MATGFSVMDALNKNSKAGIEETPRARFRTKDVSIYKMYRNEMNFYSIADVEELAGDILAFGLKQNLELVYEPCEKGEYRIVAGERRWLALKYLVSKVYREFEIATSKLTTPQDSDEEQVEIIIANAYRDKSLSDELEEEKRLKASLEKMRAAGKKVKGYDLSEGRLRDIIAAMLHKSKTKIAQIESINNNLIPELKEEIKNGNLKISAAYKLSGMTEKEQQEALEQCRESGEFSHKDVTAIKGVKTGQQDITEKKPVMEPKRENGEPAVKEGEYQTPHPEGITSLCYSCQRYSECNVKTGTCKKCDQYTNKAEAEKTDEQRYSEEQDRIDRDTKRKLQEKADNERMNNNPSAFCGDGQKVHQIRIGTTFFNDVCSGGKSFELRKNDRGYAKGDILEMMEFTNGKYTGRSVKVHVTYILEDFAGLKEDYCIMAIKIMDMYGTDGAAED